MRIIKGNGKVKVILGKNRKIKINDIYVLHDNEAKGPRDNIYIKEQYLKYNFL